jgi:hypothetical protein
MALRLPLLAAVLLLAAPAAWAQTATAFTAGGPTVTLAVTGTTGRVQVQTAANSPQMRVYNSGTVAVFLSCGDVSITATVAAGMPVAPGSVEVIGCRQQYVAGISGGTAASVYITPGAGL